jgi:DNA-binding MarR family transcriptional regulator
MNNYRGEMLRLMIAVNKLDGLYYLAAKGAEIKENTLTLLYALDDGKPHSQKQICDEWLIPRTTINTVVKECVAAGYVTLINEEHSKEKTVALTGKGENFTRKMMGEVYTAEQNAMVETLKDFSVDFVPAIERFVECLHDEFMQRNLKLR